MNDSNNVQGQNNTDKSIQRDAIEKEHSKYNMKVIMIIIVMVALILSAIYFYRNYSIIHAPVQTNNTIPVANDNASQSTNSGT